ncbi:MAG TPA: hypothetical protein VFJ01_06180, partial [Oleiagrimonas sp.]|nr:hypothetical protein [Oleiagrimonas sp.]
VAYKPSRKYSSEYLVYCSMDDGVWHVYLVWTGINKLMGPYPADPHVKPPKPIIPPSSEY